MAIKTSLAIVIVTLGIAAENLDAVDRDDPVGRLHRIDTKAQHPKAYHPRIGDLVQCYVDFPIVPERIVSELKVSIDGTSVSLVGVVATSRPRIVGSGQVSAYFVPMRAGLSKVTILPIVPGLVPKPKPIELNFLVTSPEN